MKSVEQKLYEAFRAGLGVRLTAEDVERLVGPDDAIGTRITNAACEQAGIEQAGHDAVNRGVAPTWAAFVRYLRNGQA